MSFSSEHYVKVAEVIREQTSTLNGFISKGHLINTFKEMFKQDNPRFDPIKFIDACYTEDWG